MKNPSGDRLPLAVGLLSASLIALQLALMHLLSLTQWNHFAYLVVSMALLGFGSSGTVLTLFRERLLRRIDSLLPYLVLACSAVIALQMPLVRLLGGHFDSYLLFTGTGQVGRLVVFTLFFTLPFFLGALAVGLVFVHRTERIGFLYFANLLGSGLGGPFGLVLLSTLPAERLPPLNAIPALLAGLLISGPTGLRRCAALLLTGAVIASLFFRPPAILYSPYKDLGKTLDLPSARVVGAENDPYGQVTAVSAPELRFAPGLSLTYDGEIPVGDGIFSNGNWFGFVPGEPGTVAGVLDATLQGAGYALARPESVLVLRAGTGTEIAQALAHHPEMIVAVEPNRAALSLLGKSYPDWASFVFKDPSVSLFRVEPRTYLAASNDEFDLIVLPSIGTFGGRAGLFAIREQNLLTREAFADVLDRLTPGGWFAVTAWMDYPPRAPLRLAATIAETLESTGRDPRRHLLALRSWGGITFCVKKNVLTPSDNDALMKFAAPLRFDPAILPGLDDAGRDRFNRLQNRDFFVFLDQVLDPGRKDLYAAYPFRLRPATDDRPFFSQNLRWSSLSELTRLFGERTVPFLELGYLVVLLAFIVVTCSSVILILLPLLKLGWKAGGRLPVVCYFGGIGAGYMLFEMTLIHRFVLFLGHPVYAAAAVISSLLVFSGLGSLLSSRLSEQPMASRIFTALVAFIICLYAFLLPVVLERTIGQPPAVKVLLALAVLAPPAVAMGFPFPLGMGFLSRASEADVPWAWGINGCLSVVSAVLATVIAVEAGFTAVVLVAAAAYLGAAAVRLPA